MYIYGFFFTNQSARKVIFTFSPIIEFPKVSDDKLGYFLKWPNVDHRSKALFN